jgi:type III secretion system chaperone SycN
MAQFSTMATRVIESFAANMGLTAVVAADHSYGFEFARLGRLSIVPSEYGDRVIVCLARSPHRTDSSSRRMLLDLAGFRPATNTMLHAGLAPDGSFVLALDIDSERFDMQLLDEALSALDELHNSIM